MATNGSDAAVSAGSTTAAGGTIKDPAQLKAEMSKEEVQPSDSGDHAKNETTTNGSGPDTKDSEESKPAAAASEPEPVAGPSKASASPSKKDM